MTEKEQQEVKELGTQYNALVLRANAAMLAVQSFMMIVSALTQASQEAFILAVNNLSIFQILFDNSKETLHSIKLFLTQAKLSNEQPTEDPEEKEFREMVALSVERLLEEIGIGGMISSPEIVLSALFKQGRQGLKLAESVLLLVEESLDETEKELSQGCLLVLATEVETPDDALPPDDDEIPPLPLTAPGNDLPA